MFRNIKNNLNKNKDIVYLKQKIKENSTVDIINNKNYLGEKTGKLILPKINHNDINVDLIPEKIDIYSKFKIKDILSLSNIVKPVFK